MNFGMWEASARATSDLSREDPPVIGAGHLASGALGKPKWARGLEDRSRTGWPKDRRDPLRERPYYGTIGRRYNVDVGTASVLRHPDP
jgi:hypothetical protein